ncbi:methylated-DNA--[protein]-cysteine S-methyltransferase [Thioalkalivibrio sp. ALJ24]|uniref:methylated-DNA--[protein]-cysteine S-methyltransferase n=1 Tax=Thioalkalivibrio sp. ALJ24 TaxID=545276 RepID=UPI00036444B2|nr:methylated-DNA--[protein]-cysteine S-methyltransferase [Thioalkalivibrio sp. ALJ24]
MQGQRCILPGVPLAFVFQPEAAGRHGRIGWEGFEARVEIPPRLPFDVDAYARDPRAWRAPATLPSGTSHQRRVWQALTDIPVGETRSYGQIARAIDSSPRAVGQACRANPWPLLIPCHRVVPAGCGPAIGATGGYAGKLGGPLAAVKPALLRHEGGLPDSGTFLVKAE